jgi:hypothetical protein
MGKFTIQPHGRLQEWIAHEKGYFRDEGLDYEFARGPSSDTKKNVDARGKVTELLSGAFESYEHAGGNKGVKSNISCACHWAVNQASVPAPHSGRPRRCVARSTACGIRWSGSGRAGICSVTILSAACEIDHIWQLPRESHFSGSHSENRCKALSLRGPFKSRKC